MKLIVQRQAFADAVGIAAAVVPSRDFKPILKNLKASADAGAEHCSLVATDLEVGVRLDVRGVRVEAPGEALIPVAKLHAILRELADDEVTLVADRDSCTVRNAAGSEWELPSEDVSAYPDVPGFAVEKCHTIRAADLRIAIKRTVFAAATEAARTTMNGTLWEADGDNVRLVATDGRRLALAEMSASAAGGHTTEGETPIVPTKAMKLLERLLGEDGESGVQVALRRNDALFSTDAAVLCARLAEGRYPNYRKILPKKASVKVPLSVTPFLTAIRQAAVLADEETRQVQFHFDPKLLTIKAQGPSSGRSKVDLPLVYDGAAVSINFQPKFLTEMLRMLDADDPLVLEMSDGQSPALFRSGPNYSYLVMPLA